ncbi:Glucosidase 2 subunit beta [Fasciola hepatica]|uniref:Glucosidase 2 subunit beta n=1 Tax=Fasciola hepatica TaxID=6192 RepID=A0A4E0QSY9_FASHE|nr:Glucosidase 2 subunit beta [Fasciola hepatica]
MTALSAYKIGETFRCIGNSLSIPWTKVNDDYCDCPDGSDEPGTSACNNGLFFCRDVQYKVVSIPSSFVNDEFVGTLMVPVMILVSRFSMYPDAQLRRCRMPVLRTNRQFTLRPSTKNTYTRLLDIHNDAPVNSQRNKSGITAPNTFFFRQYLCHMDNGHICYPGS